LSREITITNYLRCRLRSFGTTYRNKNAKILAFSVVFLYVIGNIAFAYGINTQFGSSAEYRAYFGTQSTALSIRPDDLRVGVQSRQQTFWSLAYSVRWENLDLLITSAEVQKQITREWSYLKAYNPQAQFITANQESIDAVIGGLSLRDYDGTSKLVVDSLLKSHSVENIKVKYANNCGTPAMGVQFSQIQGAIPTNESNEPSRLGLLATVQESVQLIICSEE